MVVRLCDEHAAEMIEWPDEGRVSGPDEVAVVIPRALLEAWRSVRSAGRRNAAVALARAVDAAEKAGQ